MSTPESGPGRLNGWKEIAAYLGKGSRTVQRWEKLYGLPVHRLGREGGEIVFASCREIDHWVASTSRERAASRDAAATVAHDGPFEAPGSGEIPVAQPARRRPGRLTALALLALTMGAVALMARAPGRAPTDPGEAAPPAPATWRLGNERLQVLDSTGGMIFEHAFGFALGPLVSSADRHEEWTAPVLFADLEGDGRLEVLVLPRATARENRRLYCFEATGRLRFVHQPTGRARFGDRDYAEPWLAHRVFVTEGEGGARSLWAVFTHNVWFPTRVQELDPRGEVRGEYWSSGFVEALAEDTWQGRRVVLVGGAHNELKAAGLAIFDREAFGGRAPASNPEYSCSSCPAGGPREVLVFPTLCALASKGGIAFIHDAWAEGDDRLIVQVGQAVGSLDGAGPQGRSVVDYTLGPDLAPVHAEISPEFLTVHRLLERQGVLDHPFGLADEAAMLPVRRWDGKRYVDLPRVKVTR